MARSVAVALVLALLLGAPLCACDPNHDWKDVDAFSRRFVGFQAAANLVETAVAQARFRGLAMGPRPRFALLRITDEFRRVGILDAAGEHGRPRDEGEMAAQADAMERAMVSVLADRKIELLPRERLAKLAASWKIGGNWAFDPAFLRRAAVELSIVGFLKVGLLEYAQTLRLYRDAHPKNPGLWLVHTFSTARAKVSVQRPDGEYAFIDEITGDGGNELLYFSQKESEPTPVRQIVQARSGRPGTESANWQLYPERDHFR